MILNLLIAFSAGFVSFLSPCVLPLIPGYISYISGQTFDEVVKDKKPILLKRHFGASIRDLIGAAEYALVEKNEKVILCERGITTAHTHKATSRFVLDIQAIPAIKDNSCLPIISDPSHACFWHKWVKPLALASVAAGAEGLMIEMHPDPRNAAVDPLQAISLNEFSDLVDKLREITKVLNKKIV